MNLFRVNFEELYRRHLCRHGHFGINVLHLAAVAGIYLCLLVPAAQFMVLAATQTSYFTSRSPEVATSRLTEFSGLSAGADDSTSQAQGDIQNSAPSSTILSPLQLTGGLLLLTSPWYIVILMNAPLRVSAVTALIVVLLAVVTPAFIEIPAWVCLIGIPLLHRFQQWSHSIFQMHRDMSEFAERYPKGPMLFVLLLVYELPILLRFLCFGQSDWVAGRAAVTSASAGLEHQRLLTADSSGTDLNLVSACDD
ncbi:MAG: hypothetical protein RIK87_00445 [Fuerstiella sp.]